MPTICSPPSGGIWARAVSIRYAARRLLSAMGYWPAGATRGDDWWTAMHRTALHRIAPAPRPPPLAVPTRHMHPRTDNDGRSAVSVSTAVHIRLAARKLPSHHLRRRGLRPVREGPPASRAKRAGRGIVEGCGAGGHADRGKKRDACLQETQKAHAIQKPKISKPRGMQSGPLPVRLPRPAPTTTRHRAGRAAGGWEGSAEGPPVRRIAVLRYSRVERRGPLPTATASLNRQLVVVPAHPNVTTPSPSRQSSQRPGLCGTTFSEPGRGPDRPTDRLGFPCGILHPCGSGRLTAKPTPRGQHPQGPEGIYLSSTPANAFE
jgi:hypothetical protein